MRYRTENIIHKLTTITAAVISAAEDAASVFVIDGAITAVVIGFRVKYKAVRIPAITACRILPMKYGTSDNSYFAITAIT